MCKDPGPTVRRARVSIRPSRLLTFPPSWPLSTTPHPGARTWGCGGPALCGQSESQEAGCGCVGGSPHAWGHVEAWPQCGGRQTAECPVLAGPLMSGVALSESVTLCGSRWPHLKVDWDGGLESPDTSPSHGQDVPSSGAGSRPERHSLLLPWVGRVLRARVAAVAPAFAGGRDSSGVDGVSHQAGMLPQNEAD